MTPMDNRYAEYIADRAGGELPAIDAVKQSIDVWIGGRLGSMRRAREISQDELARALGYANRATVSQWETAYRSLSLPDYQLACAYMLVNPGHLLSQNVDIHEMASTRYRVFLPSVFDRREWRHE